VLHGRGFEPGQVAHGAGLQHMRDRMEALGGRLVVRSTAGRGTAVVGDVPVKRRPADRRPVATRLCSRRNRSDNSRLIRQSIVAETAQIPQKYTRFLRGMFATSQ
jgi:hypothetical protein